MLYKLLELTPLITAVPCWTSKKEIELPFTAHAAFRNVFLAGPSDRYRHESLPSGTEMKIESYLPTFITNHITM